MVQSPEAAATGRRQRPGRSRGSWTVQDFGDDAERRAWPAPHAAPAAQDGAGRVSAQPARVAEEHEVLTAEPGRHRHNSRIVDQLGVVAARLEPGCRDAGPQPQSLDVVTEPGPLLIRR